MSKKKVGLLPRPGHALARPVEVTALTDLEKLCREPVLARVSMRGQVVTVKVYGLRPAEELRVQEVLAKAMPPVIPGTNGAEDRFDVTAPGYLQEKRRCEVRARALAVYLGCPIFHEAKPGLTDLDAVEAHVQGSLLGGVVESLYQAVLQATSGFGQEGEAAAINFT